jgi:PAS domain S-box-containing protein
MLGCAREEVIGLHASDIVSPSEVQHIAPALDTIKSHAEYHREWQFRRKDGSLFYAEVIATTLPDGNLVAMIRDVTWRRQAETALRDSEERYRMLVDMSPYSIAIHQDAHIVFTNRAALKLLGATSAEQLIGQSIEQFVHPALLEEARNRYDRMRRGETGMYPTDTQYVRLDGSVIHVEVSAAPFSFGGRPAVQSIALDITARKKAEAVARQTTRDLRVLSRRVLDAQETERRRVARELHDEVGQALTAVKINLQAPMQFQNHSSESLNAENIRIVEEALRQVRRLALALRPSMLDDLGLIPALRWMAEQTTLRSGIAVHFHPSLRETRLAPEIETACFRIAQEALTNIVRHADARHITISLQMDNGLLLLQIHDDGKGFDVAAMRARAASGGSIGVLGMQERASLIGGQFSVASSADLGTTVSVHCPLILLEETL